MTDDTFIRTILASPDDDGPRLVYADYLEEQGDSERAELIRVQVELAGITWKDQVCKACRVNCGDNTNKYCEHGDDPQGKNSHRWENPRRGSLRSRSRQLLLARGFDWLPKVGIKPSLHDGGETEGVNFEIATTTLRGSGIQCDFVRGFVGKISCPWSDWLAHADAVLAAQPTRDVTLTTMPILRACDDRDWSTEDAVVSLRQGGAATIMRLGEWPYDGPVVSRLLRAEWPSVKNWDTTGIVADPVILEEITRSRRRDFSPVLLDPRFAVPGPA